LRFPFLGFGVTVRVGEAGGTNPLAPTRGKKRTQGETPLRSLCVSGKAELCYAVASYRLINPCPVGILARVAEGASGSGGPLFSQGLSQRPQVACHNQWADKVEEH